jgi:lantibiotic biosynthesis protein
MDLPYQFHKNVVLRAPSKAINFSLNANDILTNCSNDKQFLEALFLASPILHAALLKYKQGKFTNQKEIKKLRLSVAKYYLRMSSRCTPFGLFSGCSTAQWEKDTHLKITTYYRHTRLDMHYLCALAQHIATLPFIKDKLQYYPNSSIYHLSNQIRFVEYKYISGKRHHLISAVEASEYISTILKQAAKGISFNEMIALLITDEVTHEDAHSFIDEVFESQLLVSELEPAITGHEFLLQIIQTLQKIIIQ